MTKPIRFGIWGTGFIAQQLAADIPLVPGATLHAVASRDAARAKAFAATYKALKSYEGLAAMLADPDLDAVYLASPNHRHAPDSLQCIAAGKAVLCEKPFAVTAAEAQTVVDAARARRVFCMEAMWTRFFPAIAETKRLIASGELGRIALLQGTFASAAPPSSSRFAPLDQGGGALLDLGVYLVSLSQHLLGEPAKVRAHATLAPGGADATSTVHLAWPDGTLATFSSSLRVNGANEFLIAGDRATLHLPDPFYSPHRLELTPQDPPREGPSTSTRFPKPRPAAVRKLRRQLTPILALLRPPTTRTFHFPGNGYQFQLAEVVHCLNHGQTESSIMPLEDTLAVMRTLDKIRSSFTS